MADLTTNFDGHFWLFLLTKSSFCLGKTYAKKQRFNIYSNFDVSLLNPKMGLRAYVCSSHDMENDMVCY